VTPPGPIVEWAAVSLPLPGQAESGDLEFVATWDGGALLAVVDGLGHGEDALAAARTAVAALAADPRAEPDVLLRRSHAALRDTRGAVMSVARIDAAGTMTWAGVGDVEGVLVRASSGRPGMSGAGRAGAREWIVARGGVVGYQLPALRPSTLALQHGDCLVFATDGVREGFADEIDLRAPCRALAERILTEHRKGSDDALVLVAWYLG